MKPPAISAIILSAGFSSRMKDFKPLLPCGNATMVETAIDLFSSSRIRDIVVVTGHNRQRLEKVVEKAGARPVFNPEFEYGMLGSIQKGVMQIRPDADGFFLLPVDIPAVRKATVKRLIKKFSSGTAGITMPCFNGMPGHPPLIPIHLKPRILDLDSQSTLRDVLFNGTHPVKKIDVHDRGILLDADDPAGYRIVQDKLSTRHIPDKDECLSIIDRHLPRDDRIRSHLADVSMTAVRLAGAVNQSLGGNPGYNLDYNLIIAASLLHDIKRKEKDHALKGASLIKGYGFPRVAEIIAQHMDIILDPDPAMISEKEIVYFADKLCNGKGPDINYHKRFAAAVKKAPWAVTSISKRYEHTEEIHARIEATVGKPVGRILSA